MPKPRATAIADRCVQLGRVGRNRKIRQSDVSWSSMARDRHAFGVEPDSNTSSAARRERVKRRQVGHRFVEKLNAVGGKVALSRREQPLGAGSDDRVEHRLRVRRRLAITFRMSAVAVCRSSASWSR